ncbi:psychosine receptor [Labrus bergylta]|uniref:G protein-coupled receptor 65 n=1 Tax=Labrus bergylta TaxID=56723 RepID=A0A3Q3EHE2_9LABR|nr:psychosine receptor-like [Labrus bergylta]
MCDPMTTTSAMENFTVATNHSDFYSVDSSSRRKPFLVFYVATIITAIPSNAFSLYVSLQHIRQKNELGVYLFNLALSDLTFSIGLSLWLDFLWRGVWAHGGYVCVLSVYSLYTNFYTSDALLCCIAFDRYLAVVHPFKYTFLRKVDTAVGVSVAIWVLVVCFNAATITWEDSYYEDSKFSQCFDIFRPLSESMFRANLARFFLGFICPVVLVVFFTRGLCEALKTNQSTEEQERKQMSKLLTVILLCIVLFFGPVHIIMLVRAFVNDCRYLAWFIYPYKISVAISSLNCLADPLLYCFITRTGKENVNQFVLLFHIKKRNKDDGVV